MLRHTRDASWRPQRVVVLGAAGFVGGAIVTELKDRGIPHHGLGRNELDLLHPAAPETLAQILKLTDAVVVISARAPCKTSAMLQENIQMMRAVCDALALQAVDHIVYISSDAVYADSSEPLSEKSCAEPNSLHGAMHLTREIMLRHSAGKTPLAFLRPTLIYGDRDPHNGYGPNQFARKAARGEAIVLFGEGEERRDHVLIDDVAAITVRVLTHRSHGILNVSTGTVVSFRTIAEQIAAMSNPPVIVRGTPRRGPMPHNGYRGFDTSACCAAFPDFRFQELPQGLRRFS